MSYEVDDFQAQVIERSKQVPVLVDFWAPWCGPCRTLGPVLERLAGQAGGRWELVKVNTEDHQDLAANFQIASIPAVKLFMNGQVADQFVGALPEREIRSFLDKALPSKNAQVLAEAQQLLNEGHNSKARDILAPVVESEPENGEARVLLAQALLTSAPEKIPSLLQSLKPETCLAEKADALRTLARLAQLPRTQDALPQGEGREQYLAGAAALREGDFEAALESFIAVLGRNRGYDEGGAKKACKAIFNVLGLRHALVDRFLRPYTSTLHR